MQENEFEGNQFNNLLAVLSWLKAQGWKISRAGLYKHRAAGKIKQQPDGGYHRKDMEKYARTFLKRKATGKRISKELEELQHQRAELEVEKLKIEVARGEHKQEIEEGKYMLRENFDLEVCARATVLNAGLSHLLQSEAGAWIHLVGGNQRKLSELIGVMIAAKNKLLNQYARPQEFEVEIEEETNGIKGDTSFDLKKNGEMKT